jgi:hypothetical protein
MQSELMTGLALPISWLLYIVLPTWMLLRGWPLRACLTMIITALLPWAVFILMVPHPWGPGAGIVLFVTALQLLLALVPLTISVVSATSRLIRRRRTAV